MPPFIGLIIALDSIRHEHVISHTGSVTAGSTIKARRSCSHRCPYYFDQTTSVMHLYSVLCLGCDGFCIPTALSLSPALVLSPLPPYDIMPNALFDVLEAQFQLNCLTIVGLALVVYDHCLTFSLEVRCITRVIHVLAHTLTSVGTILLVGTLVAFTGALPSGKLSCSSAIILNDQGTSPRRVDIFRCWYCCASHRRHCISVRLISSHASLNVIGAVSAIVIVVRK